MLGEIIADSRATSPGIRMARNRRICSLCLLRTNSSMRAEAATLTGRRPDFQ
jgi:hypothetical protein